MTTIAHFQAGDGGLDVLVHATGGLHALFAVVLAGLATTGTHLTVPRSSILIATTMGAGGALATIVGPAAMVETLWMLAALLAGATCVLFPQHRWAMLVTLIGFTVCHGLAQVQHLTLPSDLVVTSAPAVIVATAGMYAVGVLVGQISDETETRHVTTVTVGALTALAAGLRLGVAP